jgi:hypothetical protein
VTEKFQAVIARRDSHLRRHFVLQKIKLRVAKKSRSA